MAGTSGRGGTSGTGGTGGASGTGGSPSVPDYTLVVDAPANQSSVQGTVTVRGRAPRFLNVEVWDATHSNPPLARATPNTADGAFTTSVNTATLTQGATTWTVRAWDSPAGQPFNRSAQVALNLTITGTNGDGGSSASCANRRGAPGQLVRQAGGVQRDGWRAADRHWRLGGQWGSGDRPQFVRDMYAAFKKAHQPDSGLAMQMYFDGGTTFSCRFSLLDSACNESPRSSAEYFNLFRTWPPN
jgi:hypothetical protein